MECSQTTYIEEKRLDDKQARELQGCVVLPSDRPSISGHLHFLLQQVVPITLNEEMIARGKSKSRKNLPIGHPGLMCRHCMGGARLKESKEEAMTKTVSSSIPGAFSIRKPKRMHLGDGTGTYFATCVDELEKRCHAIYKHVVDCPLCPEDIRKQLEQNEVTHKIEMTQLPRGAQKAFLRLVWDRLHERNMCESKPNEQCKAKSLESRSIDDEKFVSSNSKNASSSGASAENQMSRLSLNSSNKSIPVQTSQTDTSHAGQNMAVSASQASLYARALEQQRLVIELAKAQGHVQALALQQAQANAVKQAAQQAAFNYQQILQRQAIVNAAISMSPRVSQFDQSHPSLSCFAGQGQKHPSVYSPYHASCFGLTSTDTLSEIQRYQAAILTASLDMQRNKRQNRSRSPDQPNKVPLWETSRCSSQSAETADASNTPTNICFQATTPSASLREGANSASAAADRKFVRVSCGWQCDRCSFVPMNLRAYGSIVYQKELPSDKLVKEHAGVCKGGRIDLSLVIVSVNKMCNSIVGFSLKVLIHSSFKSIVSTLVGHNEDLVTVFTDGVRAEMLGVIEDGGGRDGLWTGFPGQVDQDEVLSALSTLIISGFRIKADFVEDVNFVRFVELLTPGCGYRLPSSSQMMKFT